ncbi:hypothetical protein FRC02_011939 [Tulasnella sp. 418]|nr:hypothetical protein FRC02_011939 [Tulasnella sp. 418]
MWNKLQRFHRRSTNGNHNTSTTIISAPLPSASSAPNGSGNKALAKPHLTLFQIAFAFLLGVIATLLSMF